jgi:hypothetical protein
MNVEIGTYATIFLSWEYLFQIFGIDSLQCIIRLPDPTYDELKLIFFNTFLCFVGNVKFQQVENSIYNAISFSSHHTYLGMPQLKVTTIGGQPLANCKN